MNAIARLCADGWGAFGNSARRAGCDGPRL
jgi:hypothetical protein